MSVEYNNIHHNLRKPRPQIVTTSAVLLYAVLAIICILSAKRLEINQCPYNGNSYACNYPVVLGQLTILVTTGYLAASFVHLKHMKCIDFQAYYRILLMMDITVSGVLSLLWFTALCYLSDQWSRADIPDDYPLATAQAGIAFILFSWFSCVANTFLSAVEYRNAFYSHYNNRGEAQEH